MFWLLLVFKLYPLGKQQKQFEHPDPSKLWPLPSDAIKHAIIINTKDAIKPKTAKNEHP